MRVLVAIANHGTKNRQFLDRLLASYRAMTHDVDIVVLSDAPKDLGDDVEVRVGAPTANPWSLPFAHRPLFAERAGDYDLYVYSEDDTLVEQHHLDAFCEVDGLLGSDEVPGFLRYEVEPDGRRSYCSVHSAYHWDVASVRRVGGEVFAGFTNQHSACYVLTSEQLRRAVDSGGFLVEPHEGLYDMLVSAATDPYVRCGLTRVVDVSRVEDFLLHHLPNVYLGKLGISQEQWEAQLASLAAIADGTVSRDRLFETRSRMDTPLWDRFYHPRADGGLADTLSRPARSVLSVGCGDGLLERTLYPDAARLVGIPLDEVIAAVARTHGVATTPPDLQVALESLAGERFEVVLLHDVLGHVREPVALLEGVRPLVATGGEVLVTAPNHRYHALRHWTRREFSPPVPPRDGFDRTGVHTTDHQVLRGWLRAGGYRTDAVLHSHGLLGGGARRIAPLAGWLAATVTVSAAPASPRRAAPATRGSAAGRDL